MPRTSDSILRNRVPAYKPKRALRIYHSNDQTWCKSSLSSQNGISHVVPADIINMSSMKTNNILHTSGSA